VAWWRSSVTIFSQVFEVLVVEQQISWPGLRRRTRVNWCEIDERSTDLSRSDWGVEEEKAVHDDAFKSASVWHDIYAVAV
jgi:hypothetical protein